MVETGHSIAGLDGFITIIVKKYIFYGRFSALCEIVTFIKKEEKWILIEFFYHGCASAPADLITMLPNYCYVRQSSFALYV